MALTAIDVIAGLAIALASALYWALSPPPSTPKETVTYVLLAVLGAIYLLVTGMNPLATDGTGFIAFLGAGALGFMLVGTVHKISLALEGKAK
jgi:hypothetical protein